MISNVRCNACGAWQLGRELCDVCGKPVDDWPEDTATPDMFGEGE